MERGATSAALMLLVTIIFMFLTRDVVMVEDGSCTGGEISDDGTHSAYVAHVLSELATVTPTTPHLEVSTTFPGNGAAGPVFGLASCSDPSDVGLCESCLVGLQQLLFKYCSARAGGFVKEDSDACAMGFSPG